MSKAGKSLDWVFDSSYDCIYKVGLMNQQKHTCTC